MNEQHKQNKATARTQSSKRPLARKNTVADTLCRKQRLVTHSRLHATAYAKRLAHDNATRAHTPARVGCKSRRSVRSPQKEVAVQMNELVTDAVLHASVVGQLRRCSERQCLIIDRCSDRRGRQQNDNDEHHSSRGCSFALLNFKKYLLQIACISVISLRRLELQLAVLRWSKRQLTILA